MKQLSTPIGFPSGPRRYRSCLIRGSADGYTMRRQRQDQLSSVLNELSALVLSLLRSPPAPAPFSDGSPPPIPPPPSPSSAVVRRSPAAQMTPAGFASLMLGLSLALMLCGSVTFFIGFVLMPWVLGLVMVLYVAGIVSALSVLGRSVLCYATASPTPRKDISCKSLIPLPSVCCSLAAN